jgi:hypothetical protein
MKNTNEEILLRIARLLMLHGSFNNNLGLMNGKMGIIIFFYHLSKYFDKKIYEDFAGELIDEIYKEIHNHYPSSFENGLSGIAWGMEYLIQNRFVEADANEVLEDLDKMVFEWDIRRVNDYSLNTGLEGIARYVISRCVRKPIEKISIPNDYIIDLIIALEKNPENDIKISNALKNIVNRTYLDPEDTFLIDLISQIKFKQTEIFNGIRPLGIGNNGYAGIGLSLMFNQK